VQPLVELMEHLLDLLSKVMRAQVVEGIDAFREPIRKLVEVLMLLVILSWLLGQHTAQERVQSLGRGCGGEAQADGG